MRIVNISKSVLERMRIKDPVITAPRVYYAIDLLINNKFSFHYKK